MKRNNPKLDGIINQFSYKMTIPPNLWGKVGWLTGKSTLAVKASLALDKIRVSVNKHYQKVM